LRNLIFKGKAIRIWAWLPTVS